MPCTLRPAGCQPGGQRRQGLAGVWLAHSRPRKPSTLARRVAAAVAHGLAMLAGKLIHHGSGRGHAQPVDSLQRTSASCCSADCAYRSQLRPAHAPAVATSICSATRGPRVPLQGCLRHAPRLSSLCNHVVVFNLLLACVPHVSGLVFAFTSPAYPPPLFLSFSPTLILMNTIRGATAARAAARMTVGNPIT